MVKSISKQSPKPQLILEYATGCIVPISFTTIREALKCVFKTPKTVTRDKLKKFDRRH